jgi:hypothetical protein
MYDKEILYHVANGDKGLSSQTIAVDETAVSTLTVPTGARRAYVKVEPTDYTYYTDSSKVARITFDGSSPSASVAPGVAVVGIVVGANALFDIDSQESLNRFKIIKTENNSDTLYISVQYFA